MRIDRCKCGRNKLRAKRKCRRCNYNAKRRVVKGKPSERRMEMLAECLAEFESDIKIKPRPFINALLTKDGTRAIITYTRRGSMRHSKRNYRKNFEFVKV